MATPVLGGERSSTEIDGQAPLAPLPESCPPVPATDLGRALAAEGLGTCAIVLAGTGAVAADALSGGRIGHVGVSLTFGLVVMAMIYAFGHISGAHFNPAVTLGFALARHFPFGRVLPYWLAQLLGAVVGSAAVAALIGRVGGLGVTHSVHGALPSLALEAVLTALLMVVIMAVATDTRAVGEAAAIAVGGTVALEALFAGPITGASMNPARSFGPALVAADLADLWVYVVGPLLGAVGGALAYGWLGAGGRAARLRKGTHEPR